MAESPVTPPTSTPPPGVPSPKAQSWGVIISIIIIILMIIIGAFYAWGKRTSVQNALGTPGAAQP